MRVFLVLCFCFFSGILSSQNVKTQYFDFSVNYWFNMHHFLYQEAFFNVEADSTLVDVRLSDEEEAKLKTTVAYYKDHLIEEDLRMSDYMTAFKNWITTTKDPMQQIPTEFIDHAAGLKGFDEIYRKHFWPNHKQACERVLNTNLELIQKTEQIYVDSIQQLTRQVWQRDTMKVDVVYYGKVSQRNHRNRPYTSIFPTHVVMNVIGDNDVVGGWLELLYHETAHHLILSEGYFVGGTIWDVANDMKVNIPRQLWHMYLFYFTGEVTRGLLNDIDVEYPKTYIQRNGIYSRYFNLLDENVLAYMKREITLADATRNMIKGIYKD